ncbi:DUF4328 domain-containing protein [Kitasatospora sp. NPDC096077]|uniref:DUF4328 domain-containing protein n=1 Tax=Kitasatospora sp. NPDC096077 TaxID=3155544 RepID=UPI00331C33DA
MPSPAVYRSPRTTATVATVLLVVCGAVTLFRLVADVLLYGAAGDLPASVPFGDETAFGAPFALSLLAFLLYYLALAGSAAAFITWFYRVRVNAEVLNPHGHRRGRGWAIGAWFTPVVCFWFPRQIAQDVWQAGARPDALGVREPLSETVLNLWWATFWLANILSRAGTQITDGARFPDDYQQGVVWMIGSDLAELAAAVFAVLVVRKVTAMQEERSAENIARIYGSAVPVAGS